MPTIQDVQSVLRKYKFSKVEMIHLPREKQKDNRFKAKALATQIDKTLSGFQDHDVMLVALTVEHKT